MATRGKRTDEVSRLAKEIAVYLNAHPQARDTAEGISEYWLPQGTPRSRDDVLLALQMLVEEGSLEARPLPDGKLAYFRKTTGKR